MPNNNTAPTWDDTQDVNVPSFDETTPIEEQKTEQPLTYMQQELRNRGLIKDEVQPQESAYPLSYQEQPKIKTPDFMGLFNKKEQIKQGVNVQQLKQVGEAAKQAEYPVEFLLNKSDIEKRLNGLKISFPEVAAQVDQIKSQQITTQNIATIDDSVSQIEDSLVPNAITLSAALNNPQVASLLVGRDKQYYDYYKNVKDTESKATTERIVADTKKLNEAYDSRNDSWYKAVGSGFSGGIKEYFDEYANSREEFIKNRKVVSLIEKVKSMKNDPSIQLSSEDRMLLKLWADNDAAHKLLDDSIPTSYKIGKGAGYSVPYMGEFLLTAWTGTPVATAITRGVTSKLAEGAAVSFAKKQAIGLSAKLAATGIQTEFMPSLYRKTAEDVSKGEDFGKSLLKNYYSTFAENFTEKLFLKNPWDKEAVGLVDGFASKLGVNLHTDKGAVGALYSLGEEYVEEKTSELMTAPIDSNSFKEFWNKFWDIERNGETLGSVALITLPMSGASIMADKIGTNRVGKNIPANIKSEIDAVLADKKLSLKDQYDLVGKIVSDHSEDTDLKSTPGEMASNVINYVTRKTRENVVSGIAERAQTPTVGTREEITTEDQAKLDYLESKGVKVPDGSNMETVNSLYEQEKQKEPSILDENKDSDVEDLEHKKLDIEKRRNEEIRSIGYERVDGKFVPIKYKYPEKAAEVKKRIESLRGEDGSIPDEKLNEFRTLQKQLKDFEFDGRMGHDQENLILSIMDRYDAELASLEAKSRTETQPIAEEIKPTEAISVPVETRSSEEAPIVSQEQKEGLKQTKQDVVGEQLKDVESIKNALDVIGIDPVVEFMPKETDQRKRQELENAISEGEMLIKSGKKVSGKKMTKEEIFVIQKSVDNAKKQLGIIPYSAQEVSEEYHKAKQDGSNPELVNAVEQLIQKQQPTVVEPQITEVEQKQPAVVGEQIQVDENREVAFHGTSKASAEKVKYGKFSELKRDWMWLTKNEEEAKRFGDTIVEVTYPKDAKVFNGDVINMKYLRDNNFKTEQDAYHSLKDQGYDIIEFRNGMDKLILNNDILKTKSSESNQIQVEQQKQLENGKESRGNEAQRQRRQERLLRVQEIDNELGDVWSNLADIVGAKISLTGEQRAKIMPVVSQLAKLYTEKYALKGMDLVDQIIEHLTSKGINVDEETTNRITQEYATSSRESIEKGGQQTQGVVEGKKERVYLRDVSENKKSPREEIAGETVKDSRLGVRWAWGKDFSPEAQEKYKAEGLYSYKPEKQSDVEFTAQSIVDNNTTKEALKILKDTSVSRRVRTAIGGLLIERMDADVESLSKQGKEKEANDIVDDIVDTMEYLQKEIATESGRDISFLGSNFMMQRIGGYTLARIAQKAADKSRAKETSRKSYQNIRKSAQQDLQKGYNEAVEETIKKVVTPKPQKQVDPKITEVRKKRESLIDQWKKARENPSNLYSTVIPGLTQVDIEYGGRIALTYIEEGVYRTEDLIKKLKKSFKRVGLDIDDNQAKQLIPEKVGDKPLSEYQHDEDLQKATEALANRIFGDVIEKTEKKDDPLKKMVDTLFSKFKDTQLERQKGVKPSAIEKLAMAIQNAKEYKSVWEEARDVAISAVNENKRLNDEQKEAAIDRINTAYKNATEFTFSENLVKEIVRQELRDQNIDVADIVRDHFDRRNVVKEDLKKTLIEKAGLEAAEATVLSKAIENTFDTLIAAKSRQIIDKYVNKGTRKPTRKQAKGADEIIQLANNGAFENEQFINAFADAWGVPTLDAEDIKYIVDQTKIIQQIKGEAMKYEEKQKLLAHIANMQGIDWGELVDGIWYANVLSGAGTQIKNFLDANTAAIVEPLLIAGASPFKRSRYRKALSRTASGRAWENFKHTWKTGKHPFDLGTEAPKLAERILEAKDPLVKNKLTWGAIQAAAKYQDVVFNMMMSNDAFAGTLAYESVLDAIVTEAAYSEAKNSSGGKLTKEQKEALNRKIDEMLRITPEDQKLINEQLDKESEEYKQIQAKKGEPQTGYSKEQRNVRFYEITDSMRPLNFVEEARRISLEAVGNIQPYGTLGFVIHGLVGAAANLGVSIHKPMFVKTGNGYKFTVSPTETYKIRPLQKVVPFTRIITNIATRNLNWNPAIAALRVYSGKHGAALGLIPNDMGSRYVRELSSEEKKIIKRKILATAAVASLAYALTGGDDPNDSLIRITGNGTGDFQKNKLLTQAGWKPWSIIIGDKAISYQYLYPLNMILSPIGYARDQQIYNKVDRNFASLYAEGLGFSLGQVLYSTPMSGISSLFQTLGDLTFKGVEQFEKGANKLLSSIGGGFVAPRVMDDIDKAMGMLAERSDIEGLTLMEKLADKIPFIGRNFAGKIEAVDIFGDNVPIQSPTSSVYSLQNHFKNKDLSKWLIEDIGYYRPIPEYGQVTFKVYEKDGSINQSRKLVKGNNEDEAFFTEYNKTVGRYFKEKVLNIKDQGLEPEETKKELERAWSNSVEKAKKDMFMLSQDMPLNITQLK